MNDEMNEKILKREKFDTILAYILLIIVLGAILLVLYLKFIKKEEKPVVPIEHTNNYITLNDISNRLNASTLASAYLNDKVTFSSSVDNNNIIINYTKDNNSIIFNINTVGNELEVPITEDNKLISEDIYKEIVSIICVYYGNSEDSCRSTIDKINGDNLAFRFVTKDDGKYVYINTTKSIDIIDNITLYNEVTKKALTDTNYELLIDNVKIKNINITNNDNIITFNGAVEADSTDFNIVITLYDEESNVLKEETYEYKADNTFNVQFTLDDTLKFENIKYYSINITR